MSGALDLAISPCPNDTYIFDAWVNGRLGSRAPAVNCRLEDIATLNELALRGEPDIVKVSFYAYSRLRATYELVNAGGAMGRGCGPLLVAKDPVYDLSRLSEMRVAVPGRWTTANLLFSLYRPDAENRCCMPFDEIMPAVAAGRADAGVIIHEGRFTYRNYGLELIQDLGAWWEAETGLPLPLGAIVAKKQLGRVLRGRVESAIRLSIGHARCNPEAPLGFMRRHAAEMSDEVMRNHVDLYVNEHSLEYGHVGIAAIEKLLGIVEANNLKR